MSSDPEKSRKIVVRQRFLDKSPRMLIASLVGVALGLGLAMYNDRPPPPPPPGAMTVRMPMTAAPGTGLMIRPAIGGALITRALGSASQAGLRPGDIIIAVDGVSVAQSTIAEIIARLRGPAGTSVTLAYTRNDGPPQQAVLVREEVKAGMVKGVVGK